MRIYHAIPVHGPYLFDVPAGKCALQSPLMDICMCKMELAVAAATTACPQPSRDVKMPTTAPSSARYPRLLPLPLPHRRRSVLERNLLQSQVGINFPAHLSTSVYMHRVCSRNPANWHWLLDFVPILNLGCTWLVNFFTI